MPYIWPCSNNKARKVPERCIRSTRQVQWNEEDRSSFLAVVFKGLGYLPGR